MADIFQTRLELKSPSQALAAAVKDPTAQEYVNLCTPDQTYRIRQVQSSNSLHILRPSHGEISQADIKVVEEEAGESGALNLPDDAVTAIAKCSSTLELHMPPGGISAVPFLEKSLRLYDPRDGDDDEDITMDEQPNSSVDMGLNGAIEARKELCSDIPMSTAQCEEGWMEICAFVDGKHEHSCWRPSARMRLRVWKRLTEGALLQGIDLEKQFLVGDLWKSVLDDDDSAPPFPRALLEAVVRKLCTADERPPLSDELKCKSDGKASLLKFQKLIWYSQRSGVSFDKGECSRWVGETYLAATAPTVSSAISRSEFIKAWKDCLPESWRDEATISKLQSGFYQNPDPTSICFTEPSQRRTGSEAAAAAPAASAKAKNTRNWHELLKTQRR